MRIIPTIFIATIILSLAITTLLAEEKSDEIQFATVTRTSTSTSTVTKTSTAKQSA
jgi:hypothetical protein